MPNACLYMHIQGLYKNCERTVLNSLSTALAQRPVALATHLDARACSESSKFQMYCH